MCVSIRSEEAAASGFSLMKFILRYEGDLRSNDDFRRKWIIRNQFHPQLEELWEVNPSLQTVKKRRYLPTGGWWVVEGHHSLPEQVRDSTPQADTLDLCAPIVVGNRRFIPLVRDTLALQCGLKVLFLRKEPPGRVYQGGDLDNRLKTLFDALSVPNKDQVVDEGNDDFPIHCLLEDDRLITRVDVDTQRLLSAQTASKHYVHLVIEVDIRVSQSRAYNQPFLGD